MNAPIQAPPFPSNPAVGQRHGNWVWNGVMWVSAPSTGIQVITTAFTASGPYMPSPGLVTAVVVCIGGGGAGGAAGPAATNLFVLGGGGGGSGGYSRKTLPAALVLGGVNVTVGAGGVPTDTDVPGGNGGTTSFGALCVANGGTGGNFNGFPSGGGQGWGEGGPGATPGTGDITFAGADGFPGPYINLTTAQNNAYSGGMGGSVMGGARNYSWGPGQIPGGQASWGGTGAGGSGAMLNQLATGAISEGGAGGSGICWVDEYCWADCSEDCVNPPVNVNARVAVTHVPWPGPGPCPPGWQGGPYGFEND